MNSAQIAILVGTALVLILFEAYRKWKERDEAKHFFYSDAAFLKADRSFQEKFRKEFGRKAKYENVYGWLRLERDVKMLVWCLGIKIEWANEFLRLGADANMRDDHGTAPLHVAATHGRLEIVKYLIREKGADPHIVDNNGFTPLHFAAARDYYEIVDFLVFKVETNVDPENVHGVTPLLLAAYNGCDRTIDLLYMAKANLFHEDSFGRTAIDHADLGDQKETAEKLRGDFERLRVTEKKIP